MDCCQGPQEDDKTPWTAKIRVNESVINTNGLSNTISTQKYSLLTWMPVSILEQFRRVANVYFLLISVMMIVGTYVPEAYQSPLDVSSTLGPLLFFIYI